MKGRQWLPAFFDKIPFSPEVLPIQHLQNDTIVVRVLYPETKEEPLEPAKVDVLHTKAVADMFDENPKRRGARTSISRKNRD